ncbi:MAG: hypothetical protein GY922_18475, partial [Proteobacteria bacterium]|nr:hypothetical protein [Pseudomonadota bacterium]
ITIDTLVSGGSLTLNNNAISAGDTINAGDISAIRYSPAQDDMSSASFTYRVTDSTDDVSAANYTMTIDITPQADAPTVATSNISVTEDQNFTFSETDFGFNDVDGDSFKSLTFVSGSGNGYFSLNGSPLSSTTLINTNQVGNLVYHPAQDDVAGGSFDFYVTDSTDLDSGQYSITMSILAQDDLPVAQNITRQVTEDLTYSYSSSDFGFSDPDNGASLKSVIIRSYTGTGDLRFAGSALSPDQEIPVADLNQLTFLTALNDVSSGTIAYSVKD